MKKYGLFVLILFLTGCTPVTQQNIVTPTPKVTSTPTANSATPTPKAEIDIKELIVEELNPMIEAYNKRPNNKVTGLSSKLVLLDNNMEPKIISDNENYIYYEIEINDIYNYSFYNGKKDNNIYNVAFNVNIDAVKEKANINYQEEILIAKELEMYISNNDSSLQGTGFMTSKETVDIDGISYSPIINFDNKKDISSMEDLLWFYEQGYSWDKKEEIINSIFNPSSGYSPAMIIDYQGYPYRYQCECGLYPMSWVEIIPEAIINVQNINEVTKKIEIAGIHKGEASALESKAIVIATVKYEDNKWKVVSVENIWL